MQRANGFTLIQLVIVIIVISILAFSAMGRLADTGLSLSAQAQQLASDIRLAQSMAMTQGKRFGIQINATPTNTYVLVDQNGTANVTHPVTGNVQPIGLASTVTTTNTLIEFDGKGKPYTDTASPGTALAGLATITLTKNGQSVAVTIQNETGKVSP